MTDFSSLPSTDKLYPFDHDFPAHLRNGCFQHMIWLGVNGWVIINHFGPHKDILLIDPWPTYKSVTHGILNANSQRRMASLANWLRTMSQKGYRIPAILLSHQHFDHVNDIPLLIELLTLDPGTHTPKNSHWSFSLDTPKIPASKLPKLCCDLLAKNEVFGHDATNITRPLMTPITTIDRKEVVYGDTPIPPATYPPAGTPLKQLHAGVFKVKPYVWDHMNIVNTEENLGAAAGKKQRITAFLITFRHIANAKSTFIIGSAGEMNYNVSPSHITCDVLVQSISRFRRRRKRQVAYQAQYITTSDLIVPSHFENFVTHAATTKKLIANRARIRKYRKELEKHTTDIPDVATLGRYGFEYHQIPDRDIMSW